MNTDQWVAQAIAAAQVFTSHPLEEALIELLILRAKQQPQLALAAAYDLLVAAEYYAAVSEHGWLTCHQPANGMFYPYTNVCPACVLDGQFIYHKANKPKSGVIGTTTARLLSLFFRAPFCPLGVSSTPT